MAGLDPGIYPLRKKFLRRRWTRGSSPRVTDWRHIYLDMKPTMFDPEGAHLVAELVSICSRTSATSMRSAASS
jgi:hypothetical protein